MIIPMPAKFEAGEVLYLVDVWESGYMVKECWVRVAEDVLVKL